MAYYRYSIKYNKREDYPWLVTWELPNTFHPSLKFRATGIYAKSLICKAFSTFDETREFIVILKQRKNKFKRVKKL